MAVTPNSALDAEILALADEATRRVDDGEPGSGLALAQRAAARAASGASPRAQAAALRAVGRAQYGLGDYRAAARAGESARQLDFSADPTGPEVGEDENLIGVSAMTLGDNDRALALLASAVERLQSTRGPGHDTTLQALNNLGGAQARAGDPDAGEATRRFALAHARRSLGDHRQTALLLNSLGVAAGRDPERRAESLDLAEEAAEVARRALRADHPLAASMAANVAISRANLGDPEALPVLRAAVLEHERAFGPDHPNLAFVLMAVAGATADRLEARRAMARATLIRLRALGPTAAPTLDALRKSVRYFGPESANESPSAEATEIYRQWASLEPDAAAPGMKIVRRSTPDEALQVLTRLFERYLGEVPLPDEVRLALAQAYRDADTAAMAGDYVRAREVLNEAVMMLEGARGPDSTELLEPLRRLSAICLVAGRDDMLLDLRRRIADITERAYGPGHPVAALAIAEFAESERHEFGAFSEATAARSAAAVRAMFVEQRAELMVERLYGPAATGPRRALPLSIARREALEAIPADGPLANLMRFDWSTVGHAYGPATDTPDELRLLRAADAGVRADAFTRLAMSLAHQSSIYPASASAVPILVGMALDPSQPDRAAIVWLLALIASGTHNPTIDPSLRVELLGELTGRLAELHSLSAESAELREAVTQLDNELQDRPAGLSSN